MPGKKVMRWARMFVGAYDLSGDARVFNSMDNSVGDADLSGWSDAHHWFVTDGHRLVGIKGWQGFLNDAAAGAWAVLKQVAAAPVGQIVTVAFGSGNEPALGDATYQLAGFQVTDNGVNDSGRPVINVDFFMDAGDY